jgi:flagellar protein FliS
MYNNPYKAYQKTQVTTASPEKILLMLYEGAIKFVKIAQVRMKEKNIAEKGKYISKTLAIISELMNTLDHKVGGQLASDLENLYIFMMDKLVEANLHNRTEDLEAVEKLLIILHEAWKDVVNNPRPDGVPSSTLQPDLAEMFERAQNSKNKNQPSLEKMASSSDITSSQAPSLSGAPAGNPLKIKVPPRKV